MRVSAFAVSLGLTLLLELPVVTLWGLRSRHDLTLAVLVNVLTNPAVVLLNALGVPVLLLEGAAVCVEGACYRTCGRDIQRPFLLSLCANVCSYTIGLVLNWIF